jgi:hypothetical protein
MLPNQQVRILIGRQTTQTLQPPDDFAKFVFVVTIAVVVTNLSK